MQIITAADERYAITANGWIVGHKKEEQFDYADPNHVRSTLYIVGTLASTATAFASVTLRTQQVDIGNIVYLGIDKLPPQGMEHTKGMVILTKELGYLDSYARSRLIEILANLANATQSAHDLIVLVPETVGFYELLEDLMEHQAQHFSEFRVNAKDAEVMVKRTQDDNSVFTFADYLKLLEHGKSMLDFLTGDSRFKADSSRKAVVNFHDSLEKLGGDVLFQLAADAKATGYQVVLTFEIWRRIYNYLDTDARRLEYFSQKPKRKER